MTNLDIDLDISALPLSSGPTADPDRATQFRNASPKNQLTMVEGLMAAGDDDGYQVLIDYLCDYAAQGSPVSPIGLVEPVAAKIYQQLYHQDAARDLLQAKFPTGIVPLHSDRGVDYQPLQALLVQQAWEEADKLHNLKLCEASGADALTRKWIYFSEVNGLPIADLRTLNALWVAHSEGRFGYSVQREVWLSTGQNWSKFWPKLQWKKENAWTRYPGQFVWDLTAPRGHLPLSNQLRGVQVITALMKHPAWETSP
jgi:GUN4-like/ARM-like repeat domain, GUN4-N terminal